MQYIEVICVKCYFPYNSDEPEGRWFYDCVTTTQMSVFLQLRFWIKNL